jgi:dolichyl-phosphate-mannose--protein O-mannosyl transferase
VIAAGEPRDTPIYFDRADLAFVLALTAIAFVLRFFSPILPDFFLHPFQGPAITNCVSPTPVDAPGDVGTLCGLAYPFNRGYPDANGALSPPNGQVFDEVYFPVDAYDDVKGLEHCKPATLDCRFNYFDPEPPLAKEIIAAGEWGYGWFRATFQGARGDYIDLGFNTFGWRIAACLFGTLCIPAMYLLARRLWPNRLFAIAAATLVCFDGMFFIQSRIGMIDIFPIFFILCAYLAFMVHLQARSPAASFVSLMALGIVLGIGIAAKWIVLAAWATIVFFLLLRLVLHAYGRNWGPAMAPGVNIAAYVGLGVVALALIPAFIYVVSWFPFFERGQFHNLADLVNYQVESYRYHAQLTATHPYGSPAWSWPFLVSLPYFVIRRRNFVAAVILLGFVTQYAPWFPITRVLFMYHMFGGLVFMVLAVAFVLTYFAEQLRRPGREYVVAAYLAMTVVFFGYFYPLWAAVPLSNSAYSIQPGTPIWGPKLWLVNCHPNRPPARPDLFCWN